MSRYRSIKVKFCVVAAKGYGSELRRHKRCFKRKDAAEAYANKRKKDGYRVRIDSSTYY
jgi:hypothetical protein